MVVVAKSAIVHEKWWGGVSSLGWDRIEKTFFSSWLRAVAHLEIADERALWRSVRNWPIDLENNRSDRCRIVDVERNETPSACRIHTVASSRRWRERPIDTCRYYCAPEHFRFVAGDRVCAQKICQTVRSKVALDVPASLVPSMKSDACPVEAWSGDAHFHLEHKRCAKCRLRSICPANADKQTTNRSKIVQN